MICKHVFDTQTHAWLFGFCSPNTLSRVRLPSRHYDTDTRAGQRTPELSKAVPKSADIVTILEHGSIDCVGLLALLGLADKNLPLPRLVLPSHHS